VGRDFFADLLAFLRVVLEKRVAGRGFLLVSLWWNAW